MRRFGKRSDAQLLLEFGEDPEGFGEFYRRHERDVLRFFLHWTGSVDLATDLMAETFAQALGSAPNYRPERGEPRAWLFGIAKNLLARSIRRGRVEDETRQRLGLAAIVIDERAAERIDALARDDRAVVDALDGLSSLLREAVSGRVLDEREYRDMAASLECSEGVVRQRVKRGLSQMRSRLEGLE